MRTFDSSLGIDTLISDLSHLNASSTKTICIEKAFTTYGLRLLPGDIDRKGKYKLHPVANANKETGGRTHPELGETVNYFGDSEAKVRATFPAFVRSTFCGIESVSKVSWEKIKRDGGLRVGFEMAMRDGVHRKSVICDMMSHGLGLSAHCVRGCNPGDPITAI